MLSNAVLIAGAISILCVGDALAASHSKDFDDLAKENNTAQVHAFQNLRDDIGALPQIREHLNDPNAVVRKMCVILVHRMKDPESKEKLKAIALSDSEWLVRERAIIAVADYKTKDVFPVLAKASVDDVVVNNRVTAIRYLSLYGGGDAIPHLEKSFDDKSLVVRLNAANELAKRGDPRGYKLAKQSMHDKYWGARAAAALVVGRVGTDADSKDLEKLWRDPKENGEVRYAAFESVSRLGLKRMPLGEQRNKLGRDLNSEDAFARRWAANELAHREDGEEVLKNAQKDRSNRGRAEADAALKFGKDNGR